MSSLFILLNVLFFSLMLSRVILILNSSHPSKKYPLKCATSWHHLKFESKELHDKCGLKYCKQLQYFRRKWQRLAWRKNTNETWFPLPPQVFKSTLYISRLFHSVEFLSQYIQWTIHVTPSLAPWTCNYQTSPSASRNQEVYFQPLECGDLESWIHALNCKEYFLKFFVIF